MHRLQRLQSTGVRNHSLLRSVSIHNLSAGNLLRSGREIGPHDERQSTAHMQKQLMTTWGSVLPTNHQRLGFTRSFSKSAREKKSKLKRDPNAPKKAKTAYIFYTIEQYAKTQAANKDKKFTDVVSVLATQWKNLSSAERSAYDKMAEEDKKRYETAVAQYKPPPGYLSNGYPRVPGVKDPDAPKRPKSPFILFSMEYRSTVVNNDKDMAFGDIAKAIGSKWKMMSTVEKKKYEDMSKKDQARYEKEIKSYKVEQEFTFE